ncbi:MAG: hypothetical protein ABIE74_02910 [Pseudomonadota bacterium]
MKNETIEKIRKKHNNEWLLISVDEVDEKTGTPLTGQLIAHSPRREDIHQKSKKYSGIAYIVYSEDWPDDLAACFKSI